VRVPVIDALVMGLAGLVPVAVLLLPAARVRMLMDVAMGVRVAVNSPVRMRVLVSVEVLVFVCVHEGPSRRNALTGLANEARCLRQDLSTRWVRTPLSLRGR